MPQIIKDLVVAALIVGGALAAYAFMGDEPCRYMDTCGVMSYPP